MRTLSVFPASSDSSTPLEQLCANAPFDLVPPSVLESVSGLLDERTIDGDGVVLAHADPVRDLVVLLDGTIDVVVDGRLIISLEAPEAFPQEALHAKNTEDAVGCDYVARGPVRILTIPAAAIATLRSTVPEFDEFCTSRAAIYQQRAPGTVPAVGGGFQGGLNFPVSRLLSARRSASLSPQATIEDAILLFHTSKAREIVLVEDGIPRGIFTRSDLIDRVLVPKLDHKAQVGPVATANLACLSADTLGFDVLLEMHRQGVSRIVLVDDGGRFVGVVSDSDLLNGLQDSSELHQIILHAETEADLSRAASRISELATALISDGVAAHNVTQLISTLNDRLVQRIIERTAQSFDIPMESFCWIALGSEGRHEQTLHTDQDNGLIFLCDAPDKIEETRRAMLAFAAEVNRILDLCGFPLCSGNIMASNPECCLTASEWRQRFFAWISEPTPEALLNASIYFDLRPLCGNLELCQDLLDWLLKAVQGNKPFFHFMTENALQRPAPIGLFRDFVVDKSDSCLDIKLSGLALLVDGARILGLAVGCRSSSTVQRLTAAFLHEALSSSLTADLVAAFEVMQKIRLHQHVAQRAAGLPMSNRINPLALHAIDRKGLLEALRHANTFQKVIAAKYSFSQRR